MNYLNTKDSCLIFQQAFESDIYVDKSMMIEKILSKRNAFNKYICITRPRRFGKTVNANMLAAYFTKGLDSKVIFDQLKIRHSSRYGER
ncbi:MAG: AAA family ATPase [Lachnospiraceae bacterium]|nr:AAA family ATPase [Lachnospiraceae bacterium]